MNGTELQQMALHTLVSYWQRRPQACDTLEGISRWWCADERIPVPALSEALTSLVQRGVVDAVHAADGRVRFRLVNPGRGAMDGVL